MDIDLDLDMEIWIWRYGSGDIDMDVDMDVDIDMDMGMEIDLHLGMGMNMIKQKSSRKAQICPLCPPPSFSVRFTRSFLHQTFRLIFPPSPLSLFLSLSAIFTFSPCSFFF